jgi:hypothetical protein
MATIEKETADKIIKTEMMNKRPDDESQCLRIVKFSSYWGGVKYGAIFDERDLLAYDQSPYCHNTEIYWENPEISFSKVEGKYLILKPSRSISALEVSKLIGGSYVRHVELACYDAWDFAEIICDAYTSAKNLEFEGEELQIFRVKGDVCSKKLAKKYKKAFIGALDFGVKEFDKLKRNLYSECQTRKGIENCRARVKDITRDAW